MSPEWVYGALLVGVLATIVALSQYRPKDLTREKLWAALDARGVAHVWRHFDWGLYGYWGSRHDWAAEWLQREFDKERPADFGDSSWGRRIAQDYNGRSIVNRQRVFGIATIAIILFVWLVARIFGVQVW